MAKQTNIQSGTNVRTSKTTKRSICQVQGQFGTEFASETDVQEVRERNARAEANKAKNSGQMGNQSQLINGYKKEGHSLFGRLLSFCALFR